MRPHLAPLPRYCPQSPIPFSSAGMPASICPHAHATVAAYEPHAPCSQLSAGGVRSYSGWSLAMAVVEGVVLLCSRPILTVLLRVRLRSPQRSPSGRSAHGRALELWVRFGSVGYGTVRFGSEQIRSDRAWESEVGCRRCESRAVRWMAPARASLRSQQAGQLARGARFS